MKHAGVCACIASIMVAVAVLPAVAAQDETDSTAPRRGWFKRTFAKPSWEQALAECTTPREVCRMVQRHIIHTAEDGDTWSAAPDTWDRGAGDCEDFAILAQDLCRELGFETSLQLYYSISPMTAGHAVVVGTWGDKVWVSSNGAYKEFTSQAGVVKHVAKFLRCKQKNMFSVVLADYDIARRIKGNLEQAIAATTPTIPVQNIP